MEALNNRKHMTMSADAEKVFNQIQHPFMIKVMEKLETERAQLHIIKVIYANF